MLQFTFPLLTFLGCVQSTSALESVFHHEDRSINAGLYGSHTCLTYEQRYQAHKLLDRSTEDVNAAQPHAGS
ncbi:hypothetical protein WJX73_005746 [Symbiochloris irregularis]|uniref:Secreted protein n=1 Tax=Symbiochloris irregularis TaxID=706552 RepID=A0AAW1PUD9_9CHLO